MSVAGRAAVTAVTLHRRRRVLDVAYADGRRRAFSAEFLRACSPEQGGRPPAGRRHVAVLQVEPVGRYAVRLAFDDMHHGIFTFRLLQQLDREWWPRARAYVAGLRGTGRSRDPQPAAAARRRPHT